jgi:hypothetical protein
MVHGEDEHMPSHSAKKGTQRLVATLVLTTLAYAQPSAAADPPDKTQIAIAGLEFGGSIAKLLWVSVESHENVTRADADRYSKLAYQVKEQIEIGRASSEVARGPLNVAGSALTYIAVADPEPLTKVVAGISAWGAKKLGDSVGGMVIDESQKQARAILAQGLKNSGLSPAELQHMTPADLRDRVGDLQLGGQKLREILIDQPDALNMLQAHAIDIATNISVAALARADGTAADVKTIQKDLAATSAKLAAFQQEVNDHLTKVTARLEGLEEATRDAANKLNELRTDVRDNTAAIQTLAQISYSGWTTSQKLQAVQGGLFPDLGDQKAKLIASLQADQKREALIANAQDAAQDFGNLATIARNIGLPNDTVKALQQAQSVSIGIAKFASGDYLGALSTATSLVGLGAPDAAAERHAAMMQYLAQQFAVINQKLDKIIDLQIRTLTAIDALAKEQQEFRREVLGQLDRIEDTVLRSERLLQAVLLTKWTECHSLINGTALNGQFSIPDRATLVELVANQNVPSYTARCYAAMTSFLDAFVKPADWSGQIIAADNFPTSTIAGDPTLQANWIAFQQERSYAFRTATAFVISALPDAPNAPARYVARIMQPVVEAQYAQQLADVLARQDVKQPLDDFRCNQAHVLTPGLADLLCFGTVPGTATAPLATRWQEVVSASLIGPHAMRLIDTGITLATIADLGRRTNDGSFVLVTPETLANFAQNGPTTDLMDGLRQHKGMQLLTKLRWLADATVLQQSITYGDYTAALAEQALYDPATHALRTTVETMTPQQRLAIIAMRANPILARNVVLLALRHAIADSLGNPAKADAVRYRQTYYQLALKDFKGPDACNASSLAREKLANLFPKWNFEYRVTADQKQTDSPLRTCPDVNAPDLQSNTPTPAFGAGVAVRVADFYVLVPSPLVLASGVFVQSDSLRRALAYRDRLSQAMLDRNMSDTLRAVSGTGEDATAIMGKSAFMLLNEGWGWNHRRSTQ